MQKYTNTKSVSSSDQVSGGGRKNYSHAKADARQDKRRQEADARERVYDGFTLPQKLALVKSRGGSKRELDRINALLALEKATAIKQPPLTEGQKAVKSVKRAKAAATQK